MSTELEDTLIGFDDIARGIDPGSVGFDGFIRELEDEAIRGSLLKLDVFAGDEQGKPVFAWVAGIDRTPVHPEQQFIAYEIRGCWKNWIGGRPQKPYLWDIPGQPIPDSSSLYGMNDPSTWEHKNGKPIPPWSRGHYLQLRDKHGNEFTYNDNAAAIKELANQIRKETTVDELAFPVVVLDMNIVEDPDGKLRVRPKFRVIGWKRVKRSSPPQRAPRHAPVLPKNVTPMKKVAAGGRPDFDDPVPF
jgi:hypothetical protein